MGDLGQADVRSADVTTSAAGADTRAPLFGRARRLLIQLFPPAPVVRRSRPAAVGVALASLAAIAAGAWLMLARHQGLPAQASLSAEDRQVFLPEALAHPWSSLFQPYNGYLQLVPRMIGEVVVKLPFRDAALGFALSGAVIASCCAVFVFYACSGHVRTPALRALLAASVLLLPTALVEIANSGVNSPWYLLFTAFWALVWRPRSWAGAATVALICFAAAASNVLAVGYLPLAATRVIALPRVREQAAAIGLAAGGALQLPAVFTSSRPSAANTPAHMLAFYGHLVILPAVAGHHLAALLWARVGLTAATLIAAGVVIAVAAWACLRTGPRARLFVLTALIFSLLLALLPMLAHGDVASVPLSRTDLYVRGSRYAQSPILVLHSALIVAVDAYLRRRGIRLGRAARATAVVLLVAVLGTVWVQDFRYVSLRAYWGPWSHAVARVDHSCWRHWRRPVRIVHETVPCSRLVGVSRPK